MPHPLSGLPFERSFSAQVESPIRWIVYALAEMLRTNKPKMIRYRRFLIFIGIAVHVHGTYKFRIFS